MISIQIHKTELSFVRFVEDIMHKRVAQGWPQTVSFQWPKEYEAYTWTDGIHSILSIFFPMEGGDVQEISVSDQSM